MHTPSLVLRLLLAWPILLVNSLDFASIKKARIAAIGDHGSEGARQGAVAQLVRSWNSSIHPLDAVLALGDCNYPRGSSHTIDNNVGQYWQQFIHPYKGRYGAGSYDKNRFWPCPGNHDYGTRNRSADLLKDPTNPGNLQAYLKYMPVKGRRYYDIRIGPVHVFSLDSDPSMTSHNLTDSGRSLHNTSQAMWLAKRLRSSTAPWKLVFFHLPPYSSGSHGCSPHMRWPFQEWGAVAVLNGHEHSYERILKGPSGFPYFINGMGGSFTYGFKPEMDPGSAVRFTAECGGAQLIEANTTTMTFRFFSTLAPELEIDCYQASLVPDVPAGTPAGTPAEAAGLGGGLGVLGVDRQQTRRSAGLVPMKIVYSDCRQEDNMKALGQDQDRARHRQ